MDATVKLVVETNTRRNMGVFSVPSFLRDGDPYDMSAGKLRSRGGFSTHRNTEWWRQNLSRERAGLAPRAHTGVNQFAPHSATLQSHHPLTPASVLGGWPASPPMQHMLSPGMTPMLCYVPCWVIPAPHPALSRGGRPAGAVR